MKGAPSNITRSSHRVGATRAAAMLCMGVAAIRAPAWALEPPINYALHCMGCPTPDGSEVGDRVPAIRETLLPFSRMPEGRKFLVQVPGSSQSTLSNAEL